MDLVLACFTIQLQLSECGLVNELFTGRKYMTLKGKSARGIKSSLLVYILYSQEKTVRGINIMEIEY